MQSRQAIGIIRGHSSQSLWPLWFCTEVSHELQAPIVCRGLRVASQSSVLCRATGGALLKEKKGRQRLDLCSNFRQSQAPSLV